MATAAFVTDLTEIATQAAEAAGGIAGLLNGFDMLKISRNYYNLYKSQRDQYITFFRNGVEAELMGEDRGFYAMNYGSRLATLSNDAPMNGTLDWWQRHSNMYGASPAAEIQTYELDAELMRIRIDWANYLLRYEEHWFDVRNDSAFAKSFSIHNIGIKQGNNATITLASSLQNFQNQKDEVTAQLATFANGAARYSGYRRGLEDTAEAYSRGSIGVPPQAKEYLATSWNRTHRSKNMYEAETFPLLEN